MKRTAIMIEKEQLYEIKQVTPSENPLLGILELGKSDKAMDLSDGGDEALLQENYASMYEQLVTIIDTGSA